MSDTLSSLIAFVGFLIVFSMLVQSIQEALKNLFKLKAGVWERFFINLYQTEFNGKALTPTSFKTRFLSGQFVGEFDKRLKRIRTMVAKADDLLKNLKKDLKEIAEFNIKAAGAEKKILSGVEAVMDEIRTIKGLQVDRLLDLYDKSQGGDIKCCFKNFMKTTDRISSMSGKSTEAVQLQCTTLLDIINRIEEHIDNYRTHIENKADAWLAQINGEYNKNMLKWTIAISFFSVFMLNADSFTIYKYFSSDTKAQKFMVDQASLATKNVQLTKSEDLNQLGGHLRQRSVDDVTALKEKTKALSENLAEDFKIYHAVEKSKKAKQIASDTALIKPEDSETAIRELTIQYGRLTQLFLSLQKESIDYQMQKLVAADLPLGWPTDLKELKNSDGDLSLVLIMKKFGGLILTLFLISFGAPFWKSILDSMVGLKNLSAKKKTA